MSKIASACLVFVVLLSAILAVKGSSDDDFEGVITYELKGDVSQKKADKSTLTFQVKNNKVRIEVQDEGSDVSQEGATILVDMRKGEYVTMIEKDEEKIAMSFTLEEFKQMLNKVKKGEKEAETNDANVEVTDDTKEINGYECRKVVMANDKMVNKAWITQEVNIDFAKLFPVFETTAKWQRYAKAYEGFLMKVQKNHQKADEKFSYIASIQEKSLDEQLFKVPSSYQKVEMGQMMEEFKKANPKVYEKMLKQLQH